jgi:hypothetical protein
MEGYSNVSGYASHKIYDKTGTSDLDITTTIDEQSDSTINTGSGYFTLSVQSNVDVRFVADAINTPSAAGLGHNGFSSSNSIKHLDLKIYKLYGLV